MRPATVKTLTKYLKKAKDKEYLNKLEIKRLKTKVKELKKRVDK